MHPLLKPAFYVIIFIISFRIASRERSQILRNLGDYSFGIYLVHVLILEKAVSVLSQYNIVRTDIVFYIILFMFTLVISYVVVSIWHAMCTKLPTNDIIVRK